MVLKKISAIIFDLDNTLYSEEKFYYEYFKIFCKKFNYPFKKFILKFNIKKQIFKIDILKNALLRINRYNKINHDKSFKLLISFKSEIKLFKGVLNTLSFLRKNNIKIGILTNGSIQLQKKKIKDQNIEKKIDKIVYAKKFKKQKPYSYSFIGILKLLRIKPHDVIFIGDNYNTDMVGAKKLNLYTIHFSKKGKTGKNVNKVAKNFNEIKNILKKFI